MDIHHANMIHNVLPERVYEALTEASELEKWWGVPTTAQAEMGSIFEFQFPGQQHGLRFEITRLEEGRLVQWRVLQPVWPMEPGIEQVVTWTLEPYETSTLVDLRVEGWSQDAYVYANVSYKFATYMFKLKVYLGDTREIEPILPLVDRMRS
jgi:uncharacterized protein YndB with AHSA1/START domain